jgi:signal transduction histidine kinase
MGNTTLSAPPTQVRALSERIEQMREEERARIARELHDELGQLLTSIKLDFSTTVRRLHELRSPGDVVDRLQSAIGQVDIAIALVRRVATDLRPAALDHRDLASAIEDEARRVAARSGLDIRVSPCVCGPVDPPLATAAFRIFQEALTNTVRHAGATAVTARVLTSGGRLSLHVCDNGAGIRADRVDAPDSLGLLGMRERARSVGGRLRIGSRPGRGTRVSLVVPLDTPAS